ncbi:GAF domain-containing protein [Hymenobacter sp. 15J16-1T3B]|uniref:GAF domain-containing protein n=1 Tax=Hymenobacter sp. 15J16-1T3B TaxID=2886941 RepID=UPI001D11D325|nr:GAF domain-containing protein [Hymenobacter sp. 15J16-1T3B]MCC3156858.1 GAF domain-containing protein [Hymenobacter sp. 15J16-1T3B]
MPSYTQPASLVPAHEPARLRTLYRYEILNTTPEPIFDDFVALAAQLFKLPISLISLVDQDTVFFKANAGLPGLVAVPRADSLCSAAVLEHTPIAFPDLQQERCDLVNPAVAEAAGLRCYAGAPLRMTDGLNIGTMCVIGREPRDFTEAESALLLRLAELVSRTIELRARLLGFSPDAWEQAQRELQAYLHESSTLARYLVARTDGTFLADDVLQTVHRRLDFIDKALGRLLASEDGYS